MIKTEEVAVLQSHKFSYWGPYVAIMQVDPFFCKRLLKAGRASTKKHNQNLAGQISYEKRFNIEKDKWILQGMKLYLDTWIEGFKKWKTRPRFNPPYKLVDMWINCQKAGEHNPLHTHDHCDLSFVLWLKVPKAMLNEASKNKTTGIHPGYIHFCYGEEDWRCITDMSYKPAENVIMIFPSTLRHQVQPFTSKVTRISVAGNIKMLNTINAS